MEQTTPDMIRLRGTLNGIVKVLTAAESADEWVADRIRTGINPTFCFAQITPTNLQNAVDFCDAVDYLFAQAGSELRVHRCHKRGDVRVELAVISWGLPYRVAVNEGMRRQLEQMVELWDKRATLRPAQDDDNELHRLSFSVEHHTIAQGPIKVYGNVGKFYRDGMLIQEHTIY